MQSLLHGLHGADLPPLLRKWHGLQAMSSVQGRPDGGDPPGTAGGRFVVSMVKLSRGFDVTWRSVYYRSVLKVQPALAMSIKTLIEAEP